MAIGDPYATYTVSIVQGLGANGATSFSDISAKAKTVTRVGTVSVTNSSPKFGSGSILIPVSSYLTLPASDASFTLNSNQFTVEFWLRVPSITSITNYPFYMGNGATAELSIRVTPGGTVSVTLPGGTLMSGGTLVANTWHHIALSRANSFVLRLFIDGVQVNSATNSSNFAACAVVAIGALPANSWYSTNICMDDIRITNTYGRYSAAFTPPTERSRPYAARVSGTVRDAGGIPCARTVRVYARSSGALVNTATSDPTTGAYVAPLLQDYGECNVVYVDDVAGTTYNDLINRSVAY